MKRFGRLATALFAVACTAMGYATEITVDNFTAVQSVTVTDEAPAAGVAKSATLTKDGTWADLPWDPAGAPAIADTVTLSADAARTVTLADDVTISGLTLSDPGSFNFAAASGQAPMLIAYATEVNADTDVSAISANLGTVTLGPNKTLTVGNGYFPSGIALGSIPVSGSGTLALDLGASNSVNITGNNTASDKTFGLLVKSGTLNFSSGSSGNGPGKGRIITVSGSNSVLKFSAVDATGWNQTGTQKIILTDEAKLQVAKRDTFSTPLTLQGATIELLSGANDVTDSNPHRGFDWFKQSNELLVLEALGADAENITESKITYESGAGDDDKKFAVRIDADTSGNYGFFVNVKPYARLTIEVPIIKVGTGSAKIVKRGLGEMVITAAGTHGLPVDVETGTLKVTGEGTLSTGEVTLSSDANLTVEVASSSSKEITNIISGAGTVKKSGAGMLSLTGKVSTPVEVAAGTLDIGTSRPTLNALASEAVLKVKATGAELNAQRITFQVGSSLTAVEASQLSVVNEVDSAVEGFSAAVADGTLTITLPSVLPTLTVKADGTQSWTNSTDWPSSGPVKIDASAVTTAKTIITIPRPEPTRTLSTLIVVGPAGVQVTLEKGNNTISNLIVEGSVAMAVAEVNAITNPVTVNNGGVFEVVVAENETLTLDTAVSGAGKFAKGGLGTLTLGANITTTGGSIVQSGELKFSSDGYIDASSTDYADATGDVLVKSRAKLNIAGSRTGRGQGLLLREVTLEANAVFKNETNSMGASHRQLQKLTLLGNATVVADADFGLLASDYSKTTLTLNGHTLTKQGNGNFWLSNCTITSGTLKVESGTFSGNSQDNAARPITLSGNVTFERAENAAATACFDFTQSNRADRPLTIASGATLTTAGPAVADGIKLGYTVLAGDLVANNDVSIAHLKSDADKTLTGTGTITVKDATLGESVTLTTLANMVLDLSAYTEARPKSIAAKVVVGADSGTRDSVTLTTKGYLTLSNERNKIAETGKLVVASDITTLSAETQGLQGNLAIASGATLKSGSNDVPRWGTDAQRFDIAGTLELTGTSYWSINPTSTVALHEGAILKGMGAENGRAFDFFAGGSITADGNATIEARLGDHIEPNTVTITQSAGTTTITGEVRDGVTLKAAGAGTVVYAPAASVTGTSSPLEVDTGATLQLTPGATFALNGAVSGKGKLVLGDGTAARAFTSTRTYLDVEDEANLQSLTVQVKPSATLTLNPGADNFAFPIATVFDVASKAELILASGKSFFGVSGEGSCSVTGNYVFGVSATAASDGFPAEAKKLNIATLTLGNANNDAMTFSVRPFGTIAIAPTTLTIKKNVTVARDDYYNNEGVLVSKGDATISLGATATVTGEGTIELPVTFTEGAVLDTVKAAPLLLKGKVTGKIKVKLPSGITTAKEILVTDPSVKLDRVKQLAFAGDTTSLQYQKDNFCFVESVFESRHTFAVSAPLTLTSLSDSVTDSEVARNAIYAAVVPIRDSTSVTTIKEIDARSTTNEVLTTSSADALALFENLSAWAEPITGDGAVAGEGKVVVMYDFGISQLHVKRAALNGEESAPLYVLLCAKVATQGKVPANYASDTIVTLYRGTEVQSAVEPTDAQLEALGITPAAGEKWFAVPMADLGTGTHAFKVKASK